MGAGLDAAGAIFCRAAAVIPEVQGVFPDSDAGLLVSQDVRIHNIVLLLPGKIAEAGGRSRKRGPLGPNFRPSLGNLRPQEPQARSPPLPCLRTLHSPPAGPSLRQRDLLVEVARVWPVAEVLARKVRGQGTLARRGPALASSIRAASKEKSEPDPTSRVLRATTTAKVRG